MSERHELPEEFVSPDHGPASIVSEAAAEPADEAAQPVGVLAEASFDEPEACGFDEGHLQEAHLQEAHLQEAHLDAGHLDAGHFDAGLGADGEVSPPPAAAFKTDRAARLADPLAACLAVPKTDPKTAATTAPSGDSLAAPAPKPKRRLKWPKISRAGLSRIFSTRLENSGLRIRLIACGFTLVYCVIAGKLIWLGFKPDPQSLRTAAAEAAAAARPDLLDRNGEVLATDVKTMSIFAEPRRILDKDEATELLTAVLPDLDARELRERLGSRKGFVWVKREITPKQQQEVYRLGLPGIGFWPENKRVYPNGPVGAHVLGFTNLDNVGIAGMEKYIDGQGLADLHGAGFNLSAENLKPISLSLDAKATFAVRDELQKGIDKFRAKSAASAILDVNTGEVIAMVSLPDYDPNNPVDALEPDHINRMNVGVYEMGSTFKALTIAMALDANKVNLNSYIDARAQLNFGRFRIHDYHGQNRPLTVPEVFTYSSNIGTARMALMVGVDGHKAFLRKMGQLERMRTELPESAEPIVPKTWGELNTMTIAFGHGLAVAPLQAMMAVGALVNGGYLIKPSFVKRDEATAKKDAPRVVRPETSEALRYIMRLNAEIGSARKANIPGYFIGGKTGTAEKVINGHYSKTKVFTTFMAIAPSDKPRYLFATVMDDPQAAPGDHGFTTAAWNSGVVTGQIIERVGPLLGLEPRFKFPELPFPLLARMGYKAANQPAAKAQEED